MADGFLVQLWPTIEGEATETLGAFLPFRGVFPVTDDHLEIDGRRYIVKQRNLHLSPDEGITVFVELVCLGFEELAQDG